jgi:hypothetical protein
MAILRAQGIPEKLVVLIEKLYAKTSLRVRLKEKIGRGVNISTGVRQGCVISPVLFNLFLNYLLELIRPEMESRGITLCYRSGGSLFKIDMKENLSEMVEWAFAYADDLVLLSDSKDQLHKSLHVFDEVVSKAGMEMSVAKTKIMRTTDGPAKEDISMDMGTRGKVKDVTEFKYLGSVITNDGMMSREIEERIAKAGGVFAAMRRNVFAVRALNKEVKMKVYGASVLSILLFGSETWNCTAADTKRLESFHNRCLRCMFGISRLTHITNFNLRKTTGTQSVASRMMSNRLRWVGHVMRMAEERMPRRMMFARLPEARKQGGPRQRWKDRISNDLKSAGLSEETWSEVATRRDQWHNKTKEGVTKWEAARNKEEQEEYERKKAGEGIPCRYCKFIAKNPRGLKVHCSHCHQDESDEEDVPAAPLPTFAPSKSLCPICGMDCNTGSGLSSHMRSKHPDDPRRKMKPKEKKTLPGADDDDDGDDDY